MVLPREPRPQTRPDTEPGTRPDPIEAVREYYQTTAARERDRLTRPDDGAVERELHRRAFEEFLPPPPARVLDIGGGPGAWTWWLAHRGYHVTLADLSPAHLDIARAHLGTLPEPDAANIEAIVEADARDLGAFDDDSIDVLLSLGPFYHLGDADRDRAAREAHRVLRTGGLLFAALMPRYMWLASTVLEHGCAAFDSGTVAAILEQGRYDDGRAGRFTGGHLMRVDEITPFFARHGFTQRALLSAEGFLGWIQSDVAALGERDPEAYRRLLDLAYANATDPSILGMAGHLLFIGERCRMLP